MVHRGAQLFSEENNNKKNVGGEENYKTMGGEENFK